LVVDLLFIVEKVDVHGPHGGAVCEKGPGVIGGGEWDRGRDVAAESDSDGRGQDEVVLDAGLEGAHSGHRPIVLGLIRIVVVECEGGQEGVHPELNHFQHALHLGLAKVVNHRCASNADQHHQ
jgi:hypothetical protein